MLKKIKPLAFTSLSKKVKAKAKTNNGVVHHHYCHNFEHSSRQSLLVREGGEEGILSPVKTPTGTFAVYVGEERERFVVPTSFLSHPLFKILLEKAYDEFGFEQQSGLVVPCSVSTFQEVVNAVESNHGRFDMRKIFQEFV